MTKTSKVAIIGLDTSHAVEFPKLMQDPAVPAENRVPELKATRCLRFETPFQNREGLDKRTQYLESIGVQVTEDFDTAVADCDAILIEINDPSLHLKYFEQCAALGKPVFLDKPFADTFGNAMKIMEIAEKHGTRFFTSSALRFDFDFAAERLRRGPRWSGTESTLLRCSSVRWDAERSQSEPAGIGADTSAMWFTPMDGAALWNSRKMSTVTAL